jgi:hypothetical protein
VARAGKKTVRFTQVVERSGQPHVHTLWLPPEKDPELKRAVKAHRVMTVESGAASGKTDVGVVGFDPARKNPTQVLIFPKSIKAFDGARVVGIKFDLVEQPKFATVGELQRSMLAAKPNRRKGKRVAQPVPAAARAEPEEPEEKVIQFEEKPAPSIAPKRPPPPGNGALLRDVRAALKELKAGKAVAAYERLQRAADQAES